jgi:hypothetical protein
MRLVLLASGLFALAAGPSFALTVSSAPPNRDVAPHLSQSTRSGPALKDTWAGGDRPQAGSGFSGAAVSYGVTSFGFGDVRTTVRSTADPRWRERRDTPAPLSLSPPRR